MLRIPLRTLSATNITTTASSSTTFSLPFGDYDGLVAKLVVNTLASGRGPTEQLNVFIQSSDDGGTTFYDCVAFGTVTASNTNASAIWATLPVNLGDGKYVGNVQASLSTMGTVTGLPLLTNLVRINYSYVSNITSTAVVNWTLSLMANNQSPSTS